jgi:hypothetical protein
MQEQVDLFSSLDAAETPIVARAPEPIVIPASNPVISLGPEHFDLAAQLMEISGD